MLGDFKHDTKMKIVKEKVTGDLVVANDEQYQDVEVDTLIVEPNITARVFGVVKKVLFIKKNATVYFHGKLRGRLINEGGNFHAFDA